MCSPFRLVPDHQEVFADADTDQSLIVEVLERQGAVTDEAIASYLFEDLCEANDVPPGGAQHSAPVRLDPAVYTPSLAAVPGVSVWATRGLQRVSKFKEAAENVVGVLLVCVRLPAADSELLLSLNVPLAVAAASSSHAAMAPGLVAPDGSVTLTAFPSADDVMFTLLRTLTVQDWGLFAGGGGGSP